ncbi:hypothetical protein EV2_038811 [Malus domestica]
MPETYGSISMNSRSVKVVAKGQTLNHEPKVNRTEVHPREEIRPSKCDCLSPKASNFKNKGEAQTDQASTDLDMCYQCSSNVVPMSIGPVFAELLLKPLLTIIHVVRRLRQILLKWIIMKMEISDF